MKLFLFSVLLVLSASNIFAQALDSVQIWKNGKMYTQYSYDFLDHFPGGIGSFKSFMWRHLTYPDAERDYEGNAKVIVRFVVEKDGSIDSAQIMQSATPAFDAEALRVVHTLPRFTPVMQNGEPVSVYISFPLVFKNPK